MASLWDHVKDAFSGANWAGGLAVGPNITAQVLKKKGPKTPATVAPPATSATPDQSTAQPAWGDLLSHQLFFNQILAPYLNTLGQRMNAVGKQYGDQMQQYLPHVPPAYRQVLASQIPQRQADIAQQGLGLQASAVSGPVLDQLMNQVNAALQEQTRAAVAGAGGGLFGGLGSLGGISSLLTPDQQKQVTKQLGGG